MGMKVIWVLLTAYAIIFVVAENNSSREKFRNIEDSEAKAIEPENHKIFGRLITIQSDNEEFIEAENRQDDTKIFEEGHEKILTFGKRLLESVNEYGVLEDQANLIESGQYRIDWWKNNRRLEKIRKRLYEELARMPQLYEHLSRLGWRTTSVNSLETKKNYSHRPEIRQSLIGASSIEENSFLKKIMTMSLAELLNLDTAQFDQETTDKKPITFVYMKIMLPRPSKIDRIDDATSITDIPETSMKFSLGTSEPRDTGTSDVSVIDIESQTLPISNSIDGSTSTMNSRDESMDPDRILQLIPLIIDELRNDRFDSDERRSLSWIFGKRLWQLLERDSWKNRDGIIDKDLVLFLIKGELPERAVSRSRERMRQSRQSPLYGFKKRTILEDDTIERYFDYDYEETEDNYAGQKLKALLLDYLNPDNDQEETHENLRVLEVIDRGGTHKSQKLQNGSPEKEETKDNENKSTEKYRNEYDSFLGFHDF